MLPQLLLLHLLLLFLLLLDSLPPVSAHRVPTPPKIRFGGFRPILGDEGGGLRRGKSATVMRGESLDNRSDLGTFQFWGRNSQQRRRFSIPTRPARPPSFPHTIRREDMFTLEDALHPNSVSTSYSSPSSYGKSFSRDSKASPQLIRPSFLSFIDTIFSPRPPARPSANRPPPRPSRPTPPPLPSGPPPLSRPSSLSNTSSRPFSPTPSSNTPPPRPLQQQQRPLQGRPQQQQQQRPQQGGRPQQVNRPQQQRPQNPEQALTLFNNGLDNIIQSPASAFPGLAIEVVRPTTRPRPASLAPPIIQQLPLRIPAGLTVEQQTAFLVKHDPHHQFILTVPSVNAGVLPLKSPSSRNPVFPPLDKPMNP